MNHEKLNALEVGGATLARTTATRETAEAHGTYHFECRDAEGNLKWTDEVENLVTTVGKNLALDTILAGSAYTAATFIGLIGAGAASAAVTDTMASHAGWTEVGATNAPAYTAPRKTPAWAAASAGSKATSSVGAFAFTSGGTVGGCFLVFGTGASSTIDSTTGVLYSAGAFTGGSKTVAASDSLTVTYTASL
jgi:hypothetical protein